MPTNRPLDEDDIGDIAGGQLKPIAIFAEHIAERPKAARPAPDVNAAPRPAPSFRNEKKIAGLNAPSLSLQGRKPAAPTTTQPTQSQPIQHKPTEKRESKYTDEDVSRAWTAFIENNHAEHLLVNAMRVATPKRRSADTFEVSQSKIHLGYIQENLERITEFLHRAVGNDSITLTLNEVDEDSPLVWTEKELLRHMIENNPEMAGFLSALKLTSF